MPGEHIDFKFLLYHDTKALKVHQLRPSGQPDMSRLAKGHSDFWLSPALTKESKKKKLILADWSAAGWPDYKISAVRAKLSLLIENGFETYMWQNGNLVPLNKENLWRLGQKDIAKKMVAESYQAI